MYLYHNLRYKLACTISRSCRSTGKRNKRVVLVRGRQGPGLDDHAVLEETLAQCVLADTMGFDTVSGTSATCSSRRTLRR